MVTSKTRPSAEGKRLVQPDLRDVGIEQALRALGDPVRLRIVRELVANEHPMSCGAFDLDVSKSTSTHHFRVLRDSGIISQYERGTARYSRLRIDELDERFPGLLNSIVGAE